MPYFSSGWMLALVFEVMHWIGLRLTCLGGISRCRFMAFWHRCFIWILGCRRVPCWDQFCFFFTLQIVLHWCIVFVFLRTSLPMTCRYIVFFLMGRNRLLCKFLGIVRWMSSNRLKLQKYVSHRWVSLLPDLQYTCIIMLATWLKNLENIQPNCVVYEYPSIDTSINKKTPQTGLKQHICGACASHNPHVNHLEWRIKVHSVYNPRPHDNMRIRSNRNKHPIDTINESRCDITANNRFLQASLSPTPNSGLMETNAGENIKNFKNGEIKSQGDGKHGTTAGRDHSQARWR